MVFVYALQNIMPDRPLRLMPLLILKNMEKKPQWEVLHAEPQEVTLDPDAEWFSNKYILKYQLFFFFPPPEECVLFGIFHLLRCK